MSWRDSIEVVDEENIQQPETESKPSWRDTIEVVDGPKSESEPRSGGIKSPLDVDWISAIAGEFTKPVDPSAKALFRTLGTPASVTRGLVREAVSRATSGGKKGSGGLMQSLKGEAPSFVEDLQKVAPDIIAYPAGIVSDIATDPLGGFLSKNQPGVKTKPSKAPIKANADQSKQLIKEAFDVDAPEYLFKADKSSEILADQLSKKPTFAGAKTRKEIEPLFESLNKYATEVESTASPLSKFETGESLRKGLKQQVSKSLAPAEEIYESLEKTFANSPIEKTGLLKRLNLLKEKYALDYTGASTSLINDIEETISKINSVSELKQLRTLLRNSTPTQNLSNTAKAALNDVYDALTKTRDRSILKNSLAGSSKIGRDARRSEALQNIRKADKLYRKEITELGGALGVDVKKGSLRSGINTYLDQTPAESLVRDLFNKGDVGAIKRFAAKFPEEFEIARTRAIKELVEQSTGLKGIDANKLVKNASKLAPEVQEMLLGPLVQKQKAAQTIKSIIPQEFNPSRTASAQKWQNYLGGGQYVDEVVSARQRKVLTGPYSPDSVALSQQAGRMSPTARNVGASSAIQYAPKEEEKRSLSYGAKQILESSPDSLGKFLPVLQAAKQRGGDKALATTDYLLQQSDPEYQQILKNFREQ